METLTVSATTDPKKLAGAVSGSVREHGQAVMRALGAGAVNQAVKAVAIARGHLISDGVNIVLVPSFCHVKGAQGDELTGIQFEVVRR